MSKLAELKAIIDNAFEQVGKGLKECEQEERELVDELEDSREENESYWSQIMHLDAMFNGKLVAFAEEKKKLVDELNACRDEKECYKTQFEDLRVMYEDINDMIENVIQEKRKLVDENKICKMQIKDLEAALDIDWEASEEKYKKDLLDDLRLCKEDKKKLVDELNACRDENECYKTQFEDLRAMYEEYKKDLLDWEASEEKYKKDLLDWEASEEKYKKDLLDDLRLCKEDKKKLVEELKACSYEKECYKTQIEELKENFEEINDRFENIIQEKNKLVNDLEASDERYKMQIEDLEAEHEEVKGSVEEKNKLVMEMVNELEACRDENERYKMLNHELEMTMKASNKALKLEMIMKEERNNLVKELTSTLHEVSLQARKESDNYKIQIEDLKAKNEKNERTLNELILGDWKLVEEQEQQQLDHN